MRAYPYKRVLVGFSLCPGIAGAVLGLFMGGGVVLSEGFKKDIFIFLWGFLVFPLGCALFAVIAYGIPAFLLSIIYSLLKIKKNYKLNFCFCLRRPWCFFVGYAYLAKT
ncbi:MAG: hypothetical protein LBF16_00575 [Pseudomonadales bacterium]|jgi:cellulose synthase/poly-beta-1,6-N-acetylglucosamine synthase-like glycosyltransferase|nr:hypothetical protein [Pseudomonadales bacterium]